MRQHGASSNRLATEETIVLDSHSVWRRGAARVALAATLTTLPLGSTIIGVGGAHPLPVAAATARSVHPDFDLIRWPGDDIFGDNIFDEGDDWDSDRHEHDHHDHHDCDRHGGLVPLAVHLIFGFDRDC